MSSSHPKNARNPNGGGGSCSSSSRPPDDPPIPLFQPFSVSELEVHDDDEAAGAGVSTASFIYYNHNSPYSHIPPYFPDPRPHSTPFAILPSLDQFGPFPPSQTLHHSHVFDAPLPPPPPPQGSGDFGRPAAFTIPPASSPPPPTPAPSASAVVFVTPLSALPSFPQVPHLGTGGGSAVLASASASASATVTSTPSESGGDVFETMTASSDVPTEVVPEADPQPVSGGATVVTPPPPPPPPPPPSGNEAATGSVRVTMAIPSLSGKRKRGRPRKCFPAAQGGRVATPAAAAAEAAPQAQTEEMAASSKGRNEKERRASGSKGKKEASTSVHVNKAMTTWGLGSKRNVIRPATIIVSEAEDVSEKIISFARDNNGAVFVLAASGVLSSVELLQPSRCAVTSFLGKFDILTMSGTLLLTKDGGLSRSGHLTVSVAGLDGRVLGGRVHGRLIAASTIQIIGGTIAPAGKRASKPSQFQADEILQLRKQVSCMSQEWQTRLDEQKREAEKANQLLETTTKELNETRQQLNETRQQLNQTRQHVATTQNLVMQLFERLNIVNPPPQPPPF